MPSIWPFAPNIRQSPYVVSREYRTDVIVTRSGKKQTRALRQTPRKRIEYISGQTGDCLRAFDRSMVAAQRTQLVLPDWIRWSTLAAGLPSENISVNLDPLPSWVQEGSYLVLVNGGSQSLRTVLSILGTTVTFVESELVDWPVGTRLHAGLPGYLSARLNAPIISPRGVNEISVVFEVDPGAEPVEEEVGIAAYFLLDRSMSLTVGEFANIKTAVNAGLDSLENFYLATRRRLDIGVRFYSAGSVAIERTSCDIADIDDIRAFIASATRVTGGDVFSAMEFIEDWFIASVASPLNRLIVFVTDSETEDAMTAASVGPAADMLDRNGGIFNSVDNTTVDMFSINYITTDTTWTSLLDNTPDDGIPIISSSDVSGLVDAVETALFAVDGITYLDGREVFLTRPDRWMPINLSHIQEGAAAVDYGFGRVERFFPVEFTSRLWEATYTGCNYARSEDLRKFFDRMKGRRGEFYMPTWQADLIPTAALTAAGTTIAVEGEGLEDIYDVSTVWKALAIRKTDGTWITRTVSSISDSSGDGALITVSEAWGEDVSVSQIEMVSWMPVWAFASDILTMNWLRKTVAEAVMSFEMLETLVVEA